MARNNLLPPADARFKTIVSVAGCTVRRADGKRSAAGALKTWRAELGDRKIFDALLSANGFKIKGGK